MHVTTLLRRCYPHKGFIYSKAQLSQSEDKVTVTVLPRKGSRGCCSGCGKPGPTYDHLAERSFQMIPIWGFAVIFLYTMRRINCSHCERICVETVPWSVGGKSRLTTAFAHHLAGWARHLSWKEVGKRCGACWDTVAQSVEWIVAFGLKGRCLDDITAIGVDEIQYHKGHNYLTLVYQINAGSRRLLWIGKERTKKSFRQFFDKLGKERSHKIQFVCSDMWKAYLAVIAERAPNALNILDRFHIVQKLTEAVDQTRRDEMRKLKEKGKPAHLKGNRWILLKRKENLKGSQRTTMRSLLTMNLTTVKAYLFKESFDRFWQYVNPKCAADFLDDWCRQVMRHRSLPHLKKTVKTLRGHRELILNYFRAKRSGQGSFSSGVVEGLNNKVKTCIRKSYGFRTDKYREIALYHALGALPEPEATHRFT